MTEPGREVDLTFAAHLRRIRGKFRGRKWYGMTQAEFAARFGLSAGSVRDLEQGRTKPSSALRILVAAIDLDPELVDRAVTLANERRRVEEQRRS